MRLPVACVEIGVPDGIATMEHPAIAHIDAHMGNAGGIISPGEEYKITGRGELVRRLMLYSPCAPNRPKSQPH